MRPGCGADLLRSREFVLSEGLRAKTFCPFADSGAGKLFQKCSCKSLSN